MACSISCPALSWLTAGMKRREQAAFQAPLGETLGSTTDAYTLLARGPGTTPPSQQLTGVGSGQTVGAQHVAPVPPPGGGTTGGPTFQSLWHAAQATADREHFLHWEVAFPGVWHGWQNTRPQGGFDAVIGNPPWDQIEQPEVEWFSLRDGEVALAQTGAARKALIRRRLDKGDELALDYIHARNRGASIRALVRSSDQYPLLSGGRINLYSLFVERAMSLIKPDGLVGLLTPSGIYADKTAARFFQTVSTNGRVSGLFDFENRRLGTNLPPFFPDVDGRFKFVALIFGGEQRQFDETECAFFLHDTATIADDPERCFPLAPADFTRVNPNTGTAPVFRTRRDADITRRIYERHPVLVDRSTGEERKAWPVRFMQGLFNMTSDSHLFRTAAQLKAAGFYPVQSNRWKRGEELYLPLYQGRMIHQFDHRANSVRVNPESTHNPYLSEAVSETQHADPGFLPQSQYWVPAEDVEPDFPHSLACAIGIRHITRPTDVRTVIASIVPRSGFGHSMFLLLPGFDFGVTDACLVLGNLNTFCLDYVARQKMGGTNFSWYIVEQLPVIAPDDYDRPFGSTTARELVRDHVLRLTYTAHDLAPFARDLGYDGPPFRWDEEERRHLRARLDALYFHLYGLTRDDAAYVLSTFPIVRREDEAQFGVYRTRDLILAYMHALAAGDTDTTVAL